jgi:ribosomal protein S18 acetylase RimI-like enzyme
LAEPPAALRPRPVIRPATEGDLPAAMALFDELDRHQGRWRVFAPRPTLRAEAEARYRRALEDPDSLHLVAEAEGMVVGMAIGWIAVVSSMSDEPAMEIANVVVTPNDRHRGVARALITELADFARRRGVRRLVVKTYSENHGAMQFWRALGFRPRYVQLTAVAEDLAAPDPDDSPGTSQV